MADARMGLQACCLIVLQSHKLTTRLLDWSSARLLTFYYQLCLLVLVQYFRIVVDVADDAELGTAVLLTTFGIVRSVGI